MNVNAWLELDGVRHHLPEGETYVGRGVVCAIVLRDQLASRQHVRFTRAGSQVVVEDLGSRNGTYVNGERLERGRVLAHGDVVLVGAVRITFGVAASTPSYLPPGIELLERHARDPEVVRSASVHTQEVHVTEPAVSSVAVLESLVDSPAARAAPASFAGGVCGSIERLLTVAEQRSEPPDAELADRIVRIAEVVDRWFPDGARAEWAASVRRRLGR